MADVKISALTAVTSPSASDVIPIVSSSTTKKVALSNLPAAILSSSDLFWDSTNKRLGLGTSSPVTGIHVKRTGAASVTTTTGNASLTIETDTQNLYPAIWLKTLNGVNIGYAGIVAQNVNSYDAELAFLTDPAGGPVERMRITRVGNVKIAGTATRATTEGTNHLDIFNGTAPVGTLTNGISLYSTAGELRVMDAAGNATLLSPHEKKTNYWIYDSVDTVTGKRLKIDMERMMKAINEKFGWDFVHEFAVNP